MLWSWKWVHDCYSLINWFVDKNEAWFLRFGCSGFFDLIWCLLKKKWLLLLNSRILSCVYKYWAINTGVRILFVRYNITVLKLGISICEIVWKTRQKSTHKLDYRLHVTDYNRRKTTSEPNQNLHVHAHKITETNP